MSFLCEDREYIFLNAQAGSSVRDLMREHLAALRGQLSGFSFSIRAGETERCINDDSAPQSAEEALTLFRKGPVTASLYYMNGDPGIAPCAFAKRFLALSEEQRSGARFVCWENALGEDMGAVYAFGAGTCNGEVPYAPVSEPPEGGDWFTNAPGFFLDGIDFTPSLIEACRRLSIAAGMAEPETGLLPDGHYVSPDLCLTGSDPFYSLNHVGLPEKEKIEAFGACMSEVLRLSGETAFETDLLDVNAACPRMLRIRVKADGTVSYAVAAV